ncbi:hypothetical protein HPB52_000500 [Rhipicephalus sanguineus]|uniref:Uncharacterized protein n=1 Tax=Rhipicephalus sanguineus TaxID=34632 RepID=A0A9D4SLZ9_RHISA|nr:hypothetical protein HPB52_000500 [Rhipicephalus sanguineus]
MRDDRGCVFFIGTPAPSPTRTPSPPAPAEESMNTAPSAASSRPSSPTCRTTHTLISGSATSGVPWQAEDSAAPPPEHPPNTIPSVLALQEPLAPVKLRNYSSFYPSSEAHTNATTLVQRNLTTVLHQLNVSDYSGLEHFRSIRLSNSSFAITDLSAWTETLLADVRTATSTIPAAPHSATADSSLLHLWEAYHAVHCRWQTQKHNRRLRLRLARLATVKSNLRPHERQPGPQRHAVVSQGLLDPTHTKASQLKDIPHLLHSPPLTDTEFLAALRDRYLCTDPPTPLPAYTGSPNPDFDANISLRESNGKHTTLITQLSNTVQQTMRLIRRIANRHHGMHRHDLRRLVQSFVPSRFVYSLPYLFLSRT